MNRHALITLCLVVAVDAACFGLLLPVLPFLVDQLTGSFNAITITQVTAVYAGCQLVGAPLIGRWSDRLGRKPLMAISVGVGSLALLGSALAPTLGILMLCQGVKGFSASVFALAQAVVADSVSETNSEQRTVSYGALGASLGLGFVAGPAVGGLLGRPIPAPPSWPPLCSPWSTWYRSWWCSGRAAGRRTVNGLRQNRFASGVASAASCVSC